MSSTRVLVAGGTGFVGGAIVRRLRTEGCDVVVASRAAGIDLSDAAAATRLPACDVIVHAAVRPSVTASWEAPQVAFRDHLLVTLTLLEHARRVSARLVLASTYAYGMAPRVPATEDDETHAHCPYAASRLLSERMARDWHRDFGIPVDVLRVFNAYGPGQPSAFLVPTVVAGALAGRIALRHPAPRRDFVHVDDVARAFTQAARRASAGFEVFNVGSGESRSVDSVARDAARLAGGEVEIVYSGETRRDEVPDARADVSKAARVLEWRAAVPFEAGLASLIATRGARA